MLFKRFESTGFDRRTSLHATGVPWFTNTDIRQVAEGKTEVPRDVRNSKVR